MRALVLAAAVMLAGCANREPLIVTKEVRVPVPVPCVDRDEIPPMYPRETETLRQNDTIFRKAQALVIDVKSLEADNLVLRALLEACVR